MDTLIEQFDKCNLKEDVDIIDTIDGINKYMDKLCCKETVNILSDEQLLDDYVQSKSVKKEIKILQNILSKYMDETTKDNIIKDYIQHLVPAGTKGVIRGIKFNKIIKQHIENLNLDKDKFDISFEKKCNHYMTTEIPDWYIYEYATNKILIGMNQLDLWNGGQQINRGYKYLHNNIHNTNTSKLLCVVCNPIQLKTKNKVCKLLEIGLKNKTLCYKTNLHKLILDYFNILLNS